MNVRLYLWQRATAAVMAPLLLVHIAVIFYATRQGLTASDILMRTRGSIAWAAFYGTFVAAAAVHASIGIRSILIEWTALTRTSAGLASLGFGAALLVLGGRAVVAVVLP
jgi:fumarate reductase subunit C